MAPKYTLHYFQVPARGEFIRIIFNHAGVEFQDLTFPAKEISKIKDDGKNAIFIPAGIYLLKVNNRICSKLTIKTPERRSGVFIVNFEHISHFDLMFLLLTLSM